MFLTAVLTAQDLAPLNLGLKEVCMRLLCAMIVGMVIGTEREYTHRPAGMRTHILVALGACAVMITGQLIFVQYRVYGATSDPARLSAQVITGVGFLGAGTILREGTNVKGLTTAASLWAVACLGVAAGGGYYIVALAGMVFIFITLTFFEVIQTKLIGSGTCLNNYWMETDNIADALDALTSHAHKHRASLRDITTQRQSNGSFVITFQADITGPKSQKRRDHLLSDLAADTAISTVRICTKEEADVFAHSIP